MQAKLVVERAGKFFRVVCHGVGCQRWAVGKHGGRTPAVAPSTAMIIGQDNSNQRAGFALGFQHPARPRVGQQRTATAAGGQRYATRWKYCLIVVAITATCPTDGRWYTSHVTCQTILISRPHRIVVAHAVTGGRGGPAGDDGEGK